MQHVLIFRQSVLIMHSFIAKWAETGLLSVARLRGLVHVPFTVQGAVLLFKNLRSFPHAHATVNHNDWIDLKIQIKKMN